MPKLSLYLDSPFPVQVKLSVQDKTTSFLTSTTGQCMSCKCEIYYIQWLILVSQWPTYTLNRHNLQSENTFSTYQMSISNHSPIWGNGKQWSFAHWNDSCAGHRCKELCRSDGLSVHFCHDSSHDNRFQLTV